jgi:hypothetical protein
VNPDRYRVSCRTSTGPGATTAAACCQWAHMDVVPLSALREALNSDGVPADFDGGGAGAQWRAAVSSRGYRGEGRGTAAGRLRGGSGSWRATG